MLGVVFSRKKNILKIIANKFGVMKELHLLCVTKPKNMNTLQNDYRNEIAQLTNAINYCNNAICSKNTATWEKKEYQAVKMESMKRKITLIKILNNASLWN